MVLFIQSFYCIINIDILIYNTCKHGCYIVMLILLREPLVFNNQKIFSLIQLNIKAKGR